MSKCYQRIRDNRENMAEAKRNQFGVDSYFFESNEDYRRACEIFLKDPELQEEYDNDLNAFVRDCKFLNDTENAILILNEFHNLTMDVPRGLHVQDAHFTEQVELLRDFAKMHPEFKPIYTIFCRKPYMTKFYFEQTADDEMIVQVVRYSMKTENPIRSADAPVSLKLGRKFIREVGCNFRFIYEEDESEES